MPVQRRKRPNQLTAHQEASPSSDGPGAGDALYRQMFEKNRAVACSDRPNAADWLVTSIGDYARFAEYVLAGAGLSKATFANMSLAQVQLAGKPGESMGLGWEVMRGPPEDSTILLHTGADAGIRTLIILLPASQRGLVLFTNGERGMDVIMKILKPTLRMKELIP